MNRKEEYELLIQEIEETPIALDYTMKRMEAKLKVSRWKGFVGVPIGGCLTFLVVFTLLVNSVPTFAYSCGNIPIIRELAKAVAFSPSLDAALENQYVQPIQEEQTINDMKVRIEYLIIDQKQINIFYSLESKMYEEVDIRPNIYDINGDIIDGYGVSFSSYGVPDGKLNHITIDFVDYDVPEGLNLKIDVYDNKPYYKDRIKRDAPVPGSKEESVEARTYEQYPSIGTFTFELSFDPYYTAQGEKITINKPMVIDEQKLVLEEIEIYPTHMRIILDDEEENSAYLKKMSFYVENEKGERFNEVGNGISATGKEGSPMMNSYRAESSFFSKSKELTLYITGVEWLDKDKQRMKLDLVNTSAESLPEGITFESSERMGNRWNLTFSGVQYKENANYQIWESRYYDEQGKEYEFNGWSTTSGIWNEQEKKDIRKPNTFFVQISLDNYPYDIVYMSPIFSHHVQLQEPMAIKIK